MPELPEVERARNLLERIAQGQRIAKVKVTKDELVFGGLSPARLRRALKGRTVISTHRRGKYLWLGLDARPWPVFHFGMTGAFHVPDEEPLALESDAKNPQRTWPPRFTKLHLFFENGAEVALVNKRRLGRVRLQDDPERERPVKRLGFDPLTDLPSPARFAKLIGTRKANLKALLLDQSFAAGVGNWIADEVLYQARLAPDRRTESLSPGEVKRLRSKIGYVIRRAVAVDAEKHRFPRTWLFHHRWGREEGARTARGERIEFATHAGRTTAWAPARQK